MAAESTRVPLNWKPRRDELLAPHSHRGGGPAARPFAIRGAAHGIPARFPESSMPADLWRFAQAFYRSPGVEDACLHLQAQGADVCLLICAAWLGRRGVPCTAARAAQLRAAAEPWRREVVSVLRHLRQAWRTAACHDSELAVLREGVKRLELEAERVQLQRLASLSESWQPEAAADPLGWLNELVPTQAKADRDALQRVCAAALLP